MHELNWGLPVVAYLFLAGLGAGALTVSASVLLRGGPASTHFDIARYGALIAPIPVALGCGLLIFELGSFQAGHWFRWINLYKVINLSPMSVGTWFLTFFIGVSALYGYTFLSRDAAPGDKYHGLRRKIAWLGVPLGIGVAIYTGVLLGAMPARPFWNSPILAMLFLISAISTGVASILLTRALMHRQSEDTKVERRYHESGYLLTASDTLLIGLELVTIFLFLMYAHLTIGNVKAAVSVILSGGALASLFWFWVVLLGLVVPALIELYLIVPRLIYHREFAVHRSFEIVVPAAVLIGGFMLRYVVVIAGQITHPVGL
ncbi:MAG: NrfD/PsrC family molybdoenzyme membrane anchor subunit [Sulfuricaulis sp.]|nr:NrfD/PsrC family molybdoenzyme membrane anchor subunit [Sulfuricaulis sp.]